MGSRLLLLLLLTLGTPSAVTAEDRFVNWETPHVHPLELTPDGATLLAVNTADARLELFDVRGDVPVSKGSVPVGLDPVTVRAHGDREAWVVNHVSDSVSIVDLPTLRVRATLRTDDEPCDVVFAGDPPRAFVTCSQVNRVLVFDPDDLDRAPDRIALDAEDPRALAVSPDGSAVYVAVFESGNGSTVLGGGKTVEGATPPNVVNDPLGPYGGVNPPPNDGEGFRPPMTEGLPTPPRVALIVKKDEGGRWLDDNGTDWTAFVSGRRAHKSGRVRGWDLPDHDLAVIDAETLEVSWHSRLMNLCMAMAVDPATGALAVVGTDARNEVRFEPVLNGQFLTVVMARVDPADGARSRLDLNPQVDREQRTLPQATRDLGLGDPRGIAFEAEGGRAWITGMGSDNVVVLEPSGQRAGAYDVGHGPTGVVVDDERDRVFVLNKFGASVSVIDRSEGREAARVAFHDTTPEIVNRGRRHLYGTHETSGNGTLACGSCHADARMDRLAWDLGDPSGEMTPLDGRNLGAAAPGLDSGFEPFHPMKGPMTTQTLQDIIGREPLHWRGDRRGLREFNQAYVKLQGDDAELSELEMLELEGFLATIAFPPNPFRAMDGSLPTVLALDGLLTPGVYGPSGLPMPVGNAARGRELYGPGYPSKNHATSCADCHTLPTGLGPDLTAVDGRYEPLDPGPFGERNHALISGDGSTNVSLKTPHLRNQHEKTGMTLNAPTSRAGFGFSHDGSIDSAQRFMSEPIFTVANLQDLADLTAFMLAFSTNEPFEGSLGVADGMPPGPTGLSTHAGVGWQVTCASNQDLSGELGELVRRMLALADEGVVELVGKSRRDGQEFGALYLGDGSFQADRAGVAISAEELQASAASGAELTFTVVPVGTGTRYGIDRDGDGHLDGDERDAGSDPADPASRP
jgi:YVTN family beta-propeller protein